MSDREAAPHIPVILGRFDSLVARGLVDVLREDPRVRILGTDLDHLELERALARQAPRVAILDEASVIKLSFLKHLRSVRPAIGLVVLAHRPPLAYATRLLAAGVTCLPKDASAASILAVVHIAAEGKPSAGSASLTPREAEVFQHLRMGKSYNETANALQISIETVRTHASRIRRKLGAKSKRELIGMPTHPMHPRNRETGSRAR